jgi:hypothetical protein
MAKISPELEWLRPFLDSAAGLCNTARVKTIRGYAVPMDKSEQQDAQILVDNKTKQADILIRVMNHRSSAGRVVRRSPSYVSEVLDHFAHELAHLKHWEHTPEHFKLQTRIMRRFASVLKEQGITDTWARIKLPRTKKWRRRA